MANAVAILNKISRDLAQIGIANTNSGSQIVVTGASSQVITYAAQNLQSPMGGVLGTISPYLGIGIAAPGLLQISGASGETTIGGIIASQADLQMLKVVGDIGNDVVMYAYSGSGPGMGTQLAYIRADVDLVMMGQ